MRRSVICAWSGGKDCALALYRVARDPIFEVVGLVTTCDERTQRISAHGVNVEMATLQARAMGIPLETIGLSERRSNEEYGEKLIASAQRYRERGVEGIIFGDIFLEDLRVWRENLLADTGLQCLFPLWKNESRALAKESIDMGFRAMICCVRPDCLGEEALGRSIDRAFVDALPTGIDPCGENGEFHSFVYAGPIFAEPLPVRMGATRREPGFAFCDIVMDGRSVTGA